MMMGKLLLLLAAPTVSAFTASNQNIRVRTPTTVLHAERPTSTDATTNTRRNFLASLTSATAATVGLTSLPFASFAEEEVSPSSELTDVYFGVGCYWHIQHEFVEAERKLLSRSDSQLTSRTGYAGGTGTDREGRVCYHNFQGVADYGKYGHGEVVGMTIPENQIGNFAKEYFDLFTAKGERVDPMDRGGEYRSLLGLPGGTNHIMYKEVEKAADWRLEREQIRILLGGNWCMCMIPKNSHSIKQNYTINFITISNPQLMERNTITLRIRLLRMVESRLPDVLIVFRLACTAE
jgi:peptide methionine sulfoxide reductase MsrA